MGQIKQFLINIERTNIDENMDNLVSDDVIDSIDTMALVAEVEKYYGEALKAEFINTENFENFASIKKMLDSAF